MLAVITLLANVKLPFVAKSPGFRAVVNLYRLWWSFPPSRPMEWE